MEKRINHALKAKRLIPLITEILLFLGIITLTATMLIQKDECRYVPLILSVKERATTYFPLLPDEKIASYLKIITSRVNLTQKCTSENTSVTKKELTKAVHGIGLVAENLRSMNKTNAVRFEDISKIINHIRLILFSAEFSLESKWTNDLNRILTEYEISARTIYFNGVSPSEPVGLSIPSTPSN